MSKGTWTQKVKANAVGVFTRAEVLSDKLNLQMVALEGTKRKLKQKFSLDTEFRLSNR